MEEADALAYAEVLEKLKLPGSQPPALMGDFDPAMESAIRSAFPGTHIQGCLFHYSQCLVKKASSAEVDLHREIRRPGNILKRFLAFTALPLLPANDIVPVFEECAQEALAVSAQVNNFI